MDRQYLVIKEAYNIYDYFSAKNLGLTTCYWLFSPKRYGVNSWSIDAGDLFCTYAQNPGVAINCCSCKIDTQFAHFDGTEVIYDYEHCEYTDKEKMKSDFKDILNSIGVSL